MKYTFFLGLLSLFVISCNSSPKVIAPTEMNDVGYNDGESTGVFDKTKSKKQLTATNQSIGNGSVHHITVYEVLPTEKYVYLRAKEDNEEYWVATGKQNIEVGTKYFFKDGLLKTNFESKEYNRTFDKVYLVSKLVPENHAQQSSNENSPAIKIKPLEIELKRINKVNGSISIKEVVQNAASLEGEEIQITGECTKLNANIMGRNWIHLKDGTLDNYDFVVTSDQAIPEGHVVTLKGTVARNRDFGSGYRYELLIENASVVRE
jgi:hypothetical protein